MIRCILKSTFRDEHSGAEGSDFLTVDIEAPELERALTFGGRSENGFHRVELAGVEVRPGTIPEEETS